MSHGRYQCDPAGWRGAANDGTLEGMFPIPSYVGPARGIRAILSDCGDTLADEASEQQTADRVTLEADLLPADATWQ